MFVGVIHVVFIFYYSLGPISQFSRCFCVFFYIFTNTGGTITLDIAFYNEEITIPFSPGFSVFHSMIILFIFMIEFLKVNAPPMTSPSNYRIPLRFPHCLLHDWWLV